MPKCFFCNTDLEVEKPGRRETCTNCQNDLHCCMQCIFYDAPLHNSCRETQAERVVEKDRSNFCGYFSFGRDPEKEANLKSDTKNQLDALFKKQQTT